MKAPRPKWTYHGKKMNFTEMLGIIIVIFSMICILLSYILAFQGKEIAENLSTTFVVSILGTFLGLSLKSLFEKMSINKHIKGENKLAAGIDEGYDDTTIEEDNGDVQE